MCTYRVAFFSLQLGALQNYSPKTWTTLGPKLGFLKSRGIVQNLAGDGANFCCKSVIDSGSLAGITPDERVEDGSILTGDGSELRSTVRLVECAMLAAIAGLAYFLSNLLRLEVCISVNTYFELSCSVLFEAFGKVSVFGLLVRSKQPRKCILKEVAKLRGDV